MTDLTELNVGDKAHVVDFNEGSAYYRQRLLSFGLVPGANFAVTHVAPLGDPVQICLAGGMSLSLRKIEATILKVAKVG